MESEVLREKVEWEAQRVAAAFGANCLSGESRPDYFQFRDQLRENVNNKDIVWTISKETEELNFIRLGAGNNRCCVSKYSGTWSRLGHPDFDKQMQMARGLYRLSFEDETILAQLPALSAHEKLELRLSMPREFWPQKWLDEEGENC